MCVCVCGASLEAETELLVTGPQNHPNTGERFAKRSDGVAILHSPSAKRTNGCRDCSSFLGSEGGLVGSVQRIFLPLKATNVWFHELAGFC